MAYFPRRQFDGVEGERSIDRDGPRAIQRDLDELIKMFDPSTVHDDGAQGGISTGNMSDDFWNGDNSTAAVDLIESHEIDGLYEVDDPSSPAITLWQQIKSIWHSITELVSESFPLYNGLDQPNAGISALDSRQGSVLKGLIDSLATKITNVANSKAHFDVTLVPSSWADGVYEIVNERIKVHPQLVQIAFLDGQSEEVSNALVAAKLTLTQSDGVLRLSAGGTVPTVDIGIAVYLEDFA
jgi:hypothetical protein